MSRVKGTVLMQVVRGLRSYGEAAQAATPESLHSYLQAQVLPSSWYDEKDYLALMEVLAELVAVPIPELDVWEYMGRAGSEGYYGSGAVYRTLLRKGDPTGTLKNFDKLWKLGHDSGEITVSIDEPCFARLQLRGYEVVSAGLCRSNTGTLWGALTHSGGTDIQIKKTRCTAEGNELCEWQAKWQDPPRD